MFCTRYPKRLKNYILMVVFILFTLKLLYSTYIFLFKSWNVSIKKIDFKFGDIDGHSHTIILWVTIQQLGKITKIRKCLFKYILSVYK